ncbi:MAG: hypothetical protein HYR85_24845 [Planctomycetes bacterium]|nr:hypothetical protein [Planctomycetota bacterium]MBI3846077.1 hypothetical protein [Planctomycetota bacterium]
MFRMLDWLAPLEAIALSFVAGSLLLRVAFLRQSATAMLATEDALAFRFASPTWLLPFVRWPAGVACAVAIVRLAGSGSFVGVALAALAFVLSFTWAAIPLRKTDEVARQWANSAEAPDLVRLASIERLDRLLALGAAIAALAGLAEILVG